MILVTGASGVTGKAVIRACANRGLDVRACIHSARRTEEMLSIGATEVVVADIADAAQMREACEGVEAIYHICPTMREDEREIERTVIDAAKDTGVSHFVFQSVLHSILDDMAHHAAKHDVERMLAQSNIPYTIIQPAVLMQNVAQSWKSLVDDGVFMQKYYINDETRMNMVDFDEVAEVVAMILAEPATHDGATYELCGPQNLTRPQMQEALDAATGRKIQMRFIEDETILAGLEAQGSSDYRKQGMLKMFHHYNNQDFTGSCLTLEAFLGRRPTSLVDYIARRLIEDQAS